MILPTTRASARFIAENLSDDEICIRLYGREEASRLAYHVATTSPLSWTAHAIDGEPVAMFGAFPDDEEAFAHGWMFSTAKVKRAARSVLLGMREAVKVTHRYWPEIRIDAEPRLDRQSKFLERIGFRPRTVETVNGERLVELVQ